MSTTDPLARIREVIEAREAAGLRRILRPRSAHDNVLDLAGNDYLGLCEDPRVTTAAAEAARTWGAGATGSRLVTGTTRLHARLEDELAAFAGAPASLVFSSGYLANLGALTALGGPDVTIVSDSGNHASLIDACRLSGSPITVVPHRDVDKFEAALATVDTPHAMVVTDAVFSVDGDVAPLADLHRISQQYQAILVVDEAHSLGVVGPEGRGAVAAAGLAGASDVVRTVTLSKALGSQGGAVVGAPEVVELLISTARSFIFDTGLAPSSAAGALAALRVLVAQPSLADAVRTNAQRLADLVASLGAETVTPDAAVVPAFLGDPLRAVAAADACLQERVRVGCFRPPSVPVGRSCLRLTARANLTESDFSRAEAALAKALA